MPEIPEFNSKEQIYYQKMSAFFRNNGHKDVVTATVPYRVAGNSVNLTIVGRDNEMVRNTIDYMITRYTDRMFYRSGLIGHGPECVVLLGDMANKLSVLNLESGPGYATAHRIKLNSSMFKNGDYGPVPGAESTTRRRIVEQDGHRTVLVKTPFTGERSVLEGDEREGMERRYREALGRKDAASAEKFRKELEKTMYDFRIGDIHKDIIRSVTDNTLATWGNLIAVDHPTEGKRGILYIGGHGVSKTETSVTSIDYGAQLVDDDAVIIHKKGYVGGSGYRCIYSQKEFFRKPDIDSNIDLSKDTKKYYDSGNPETSPKHSRFFLDQTPPHRHFPLEYMPEKLLINRRGAKVSEIYHPSPVQLDTIAFFVPYLEGYYNMWFKKEHPSERDVTEAFQGLEGFGSDKKQFHKMSARQAADYVSEWFEVTREIDPEDKSSINNLKEGPARHLDSELFDIFGRQWMLKHSEEYCSGSGAHAGWMESNVMDAIKSAKRFYVIGKRSPPQPNRRLSETLVDIVSEKKTFAPLDYALGGIKQIEEN